MDDHIAMLAAAAAGCVTALAGKLPAWVDKWVVARIDREPRDGSLNKNRKRVRKAIRVGVPKSISASRLAGLRRSCAALSCHVVVAGLWGRPRAYEPDVSCVALVRGCLITRIFACDISFGPSRYDDFGEWDRLVAHLTSRAKQVLSAIERSQRSVL